MDRPEPLEQVIVTEPAMAHLLLSEDDRRFLALFVAAPRSVSEVAALLGEDRRRVLYKVRKLVRHDLLQISGLQPRAGRVIKKYRASARQFIVPYAASRAATAAEFVELIEGALRDAYYESFLPDGEVERFGVQIGEGDDPEALAVTVVLNVDGVWRNPDEVGIETVNRMRLSLLRLSPQDAEALGDELDAVLERYLEREVAGGVSYLLRLGLVRLRR